MASGMMMKYLFWSSGCPSPKRKSAVSDFRNWRLLPAIRMPPWIFGPLSQICRHTPKRTSHCWSRKVRCRTPRQRRSYPRHRPIPPAIVLLRLRSSKFPPALHPASLTPHTPPAANRYCSNGDVNMSENRCALDGIAQLMEPNTRRRSWSSARSTKGQ